MKDKTFLEHKGSTTDATGLRSANTMTDPITEQGWTATEHIPGIDPGENAPMNSVVGSPINFGGGGASGVPFSGNVGGPVADEVPPLNILMSVNEPMGPTTGAGLRSAVDEPIRFGKK